MSGLLRSGTMGGTESNMSECNRGFSRNSDNGAQGVKPRDRLNHEAEGEHEAWVDCACDRTCDCASVGDACTEGEDKGKGEGEEELVCLCVSGLSTTSANNDDIFPRRP